MYEGKTSGKIVRKHKPYTGPETGRYGVQRRCYPWKKTPLGQKGLCYLYKYMRKFATDDDIIARPFAQLGITAQGALKYLEKKLPGLPVEFKERTGNALTKIHVSGRMANMRRNNERCNFEQGPEHPKNHPVLQPVLDAINENDKED